MWEKEKMLVAFYPFPTICFLPFPKQFSIFQSHLFCRLQMLSISTCLKFCPLVTSKGLAQNTWKKTSYQHFLLFSRNVFKTFPGDYNVVRTRNCTVKGQPFTTQSRFFSNDHIKKTFGNIVRKEKMLVTIIFSFSHNVFYPSYDNFQFFSQVYFVVCKCF